MASKGRVFVVGVGMTKFEKPGKVDWDYPDMAKQAVTRCLADAGIPYDAVQQATVGYVYGDSTCGQRALYQMGLTGIPIYNVNNNCSTGASALYLARQFIQGGLADCVLALGFEKMEKGSLGSKFQDRTNPMDQHVSVMSDNWGVSAAPFAPQMFGNAGREHMKRYGTTKEHFAKIAEKNHRHSANNPYSQFQDIYTLDQIMKSKTIHEPLTFLQCCPTSDGAASALLVSEKFVYKYGLQNKAVEIIGMSMATDLKSTFTNDMMKTVGYDMTVKASQEVYREAGYSAKDVQVVELHDCFSANELITYEALGLCPEGKAGEFIDKGDNTYGGRVVVNPSGGLISKGHPLGATGLAQCAELCWQVRGEADKRQVKGAKIGLQHNLGLGGACVIAMYKKADFAPGRTVPVDNASRAEALGNAGAAPLSAPAAAPVAASAPAPAPKSAPAAPAAPAAGKGGALQSEAVFAELKKRLSADIVKKVGVIYRFDISPDAGGAARSFVLDLKNGGGSIAEKAEGGECIISMKDSDFVALMTGKLNAQSAFMKGKLKIKGNMMLAQKLQALTGAPSKL